MKKTIMILVALMACVGCFAHDYKVFVTSENASKRKAEARRIGSSIDIETVEKAWNELKSENDFVRIAIAKNREVLIQTVIDVDMESVLVTISVPREGVTQTFSQMFGKAFGPAVLESVPHFEYDDNTTLVKSFRINQ